jgi:hypothetical protein
VQGLSTTGSKAWFFPNPEILSTHSLELEMSW